jgi:hypothetical protein
VREKIGRDLKYIYLRQKERKRKVSILYTYRKRGKKRVVILREREDMKTEQDIHIIYI